jgi:hypothetical protein
LGSHIPARRDAEDPLDSVAARIGERRCRQPERKCTAVVSGLDEEIEIDHEADHLQIANADLAAQAWQ